MNLSKFKKRLKIGSKVAVNYHLKNDGIDTETNLVKYKDESRPIRTVVGVNTSSFELATKRNGKWEARKVKFPPAKKCRFEGDDLIILGKDLDNPDQKELVKWATIKIVK